MAYQLVIFDFDGTLADSFPWFLSVFDELAERYHLPPVQPGDLDRLREMDVRQILKEYQIPLWKMVLIGNHLKKMMTSQIDRVGLVAGIAPVIAALGEQGVKLAVVTSNAEENVRRVLGAGSMQYISWVESGASMFGKKGRFQKVLKLAGVPAGQALSVGDELRDLRAAHAAHIPFGAVSWGYTGLKLLRSHGPEEVFEHPAQILEAVRRSGETG